MFDAVVLAVDMPKGVSFFLLCFLLWRRAPTNMIPTQTMPTSRPVFAPGESPLVEFFEDDAGSVAVVLADWLLNGTKTPF
jgi:hypothetical protein